MVPDTSALGWSVNEIEMLALKAARGRGAHPAQAAHFGKALVYYLAETQDAGPPRALLDALPGGSVQTLPVAERLDDQDPMQRCYAILRKPPADRPALPARLKCPAALMDALTNAAALTYVPNSDASRAAGAGAGLSDND